MKTKGDPVKDAILKEEVKQFIARKTIFGGTSRVHIVSYGDNAAQLFKRM